MGVHCKKKKQVQKYQMDGILQLVSALLMFCKIKDIWRNKLLQKFPVLALFWTVNYNSFYLLLIISLKYKCDVVHCKLRNVN